MKVQENSKALYICERPKFAAYGFVKVYRIPNKLNTIKNNPMKEQELKKDHLLPGQMVYADHYILRAIGSLCHTKGKLDTSDIFLGGCVFIDHAIGCLRINHQVVINATETVKAKITFEREDQSQVVIINVYPADNGIFNTSKCMKYLLNK